MATLFFKRQVLNAQWLMMLAMVMLASSFILMGCLFNPFLKNEYLLLMLFLVVIILTPPIVHVAITMLTHRDASSLSVRALFLPSLLYIVLLILSVIIGGSDMYLLWSSRGLEGLTGVFYPNSWRYNFIVFVNFYLFWGLYVFEFIYILIKSIKQFIHFKKINSEYYTTDRFQHLNLKGLFVAANAGMIMLFVISVTNPFDESHGAMYHAALGVPMAAIILYIGRSIYMINNGAERLRGSRRMVPGRRNQDMGRMLEEYLEKEQAFRNPDLSVFLLAEYMHTSEDEIIDIIHRRTGTTFGEYIDSIRIEYATSQLVGGLQLNVDDPDDMNRFAHQCGYLNAADMQRSFSSVMHTSMANWIASVVNKD
ncbi:MAG: helix-turn-helix domain-containing protein [Bacteroidales bacterium]|nr:helix-turn-helix domain-containing protein [Bacteroidales bacterium]